MIRPSGTHTQKIPARTNTSNRRGDVALDKSLYSYIYIYKFWFVAMKDVTKPFELYYGGYISYSHMYTISIDLVIFFLDTLCNFKILPTTQIPLHTE